MSRPLCRNCGKPIAKRTTPVYFITAEEFARRQNDGTTWAIYVAGDPRTRAEAQRMVNQEIVSISRGANRYGQHDPELIASATVWDGQRYESQHFCTGTCAQAFAYMVAKNHPEIRTVDHADAVRRQKAKEAAP